jgi:hypothetical protein
VDPPVAKVSSDEELVNCASWEERQSQRDFAPTFTQRALTGYAAFLVEKPSLMLGDFNTTAVFDAERPASHSSLGRKLNGLGFVSGGGRQRRM